MEPRLLSCVFSDVGILSARPVLVSRARCLARPRRSAATFHSFCGAAAPAAFRPGPARQNLCAFSRRAGFERACGRTYMMTLFEKPASRGDLNELQRLTSLCFDFDKTECAERASTNGHLEVVRYLAEVGADVSANRHGCMCLASMRGHLTVVRYLVELAADARDRARVDNGLVMASVNGHETVVRYLVSVGANVRVDHNASMRLASAYDGTKAVTRFRVSVGADVRAQRRGRAIRGGGRSRDARAVSNRARGRRSRARQHCCAKCLDARAGRSAALLRVGPALLRPPAARGRGMARRNLRAYLRLAGISGI